MPPMIEPVGNLLCMIDTHPEKLDEQDTSCYTGVT